MIRFACFMNFRIGPVLLKLKYFFNGPTKLMAALELCKYRLFMAPLNFVIEERNGVKK